MKFTNGREIWYLYWSTFYGIVYENMQVLTKVIQGVGLSAELSQILPVCGIQITYRLVSTNGQIYNNHLGITKQPQTVNHRVSSALN